MLKHKWTIAALLATVAVGSLILCCCGLAVVLPQFKADVATRIRTREVHENTTNILTRWATSINDNDSDSAGSAAETYKKLYLELSRADVSDTSPDYRIAYANVLTALEEVLDLLLDMDFEGEASERSAARFKASASELDGLLKELGRVGEREG